MTSDQHHCELRVLLGPQAGSRLALSSGEYLLGSSDECTIILSGPRMQPQHLMLKVSDDAVHVLPQEGGARDAAGAEIAQDRSIALGEALELGGIWIAVDRNDAPWPDAQTIGELGAAPRAAASAHGVSPQIELPTVAAGAPHGVSSEVRSSRRRWGSLAMLLAALGGVAACVGFGLQVLLASEGEGLAEAALPLLLATATPTPTPPTTPNAVLQRLDPTGRLTAKQIEGGGTWRVSGYLPTTQERQTIVRALSGLTPPPEIQVYCEDELLAAAGELLAVHSPGSMAKVRVESVGKGTLRLTGAARDASLVEAAAVFILKGVPGVGTVESAAVLLPSALLAQLKTRLVQADLENRVSVVSEQPEVVLGGTLTVVESARWDRLHAAFRDQYAEALPLRTAFTRPTPKLPFEVKTIVGGPAPYIVISTGEHVARGGQIGGLTLSSIGDSQVVFDGNQRLTLSR